MIHFGLQRLAPAALIDAFGDMTIEIAIGALGNAPGPMNIERKRIRHRYDRPDRTVVSMGQAAKQAATSFRKASAR